MEDVNKNSEHHDPKEDNSNRKESLSPLFQSKEVDLGEVGFKLLLVDLLKPLVEQFEKHFQDLPNVEGFHGPFEKLSTFDCMVSAANSFGLMDGGVDYAITEYFGDQLQERVQQRIIQEYDAEQPVGTSFIIETMNKEHPYLAHTPTMRAPYSVKNTDNVYLAMKAMLRAVKDHNLAVTKESKKIRTVACSGLGTHCGRLEYCEAARQMALAYRNFLFVPKEINWDLARERRQAVRYGSYDDFLKPAAGSEKEQKQQSNQHSCWGRKNH